MFLSSVRHGRLWKILFLIVLVISGIVLFPGRIFSVDERTEILLDEEPRMVAISPAANLAVVTHRRADSVSLVDLTAGRVIRELPVGRSPRSVAIDAELNLAVITYEKEKSVTLIDLTRSRIAADIHVGESTGSVAVNSRTHIAAVTSPGEVHLFFLDLTRRKIIARTPVGRHAGDIALDPESNTAFLLNPERRKLFIIDLNHYRVSEVLNLRERPRAVDVNPQTQTLLIANARDASVTQIDLLHRRSLPISVLRFPRDVAFNTVDNRAVILCDRDRRLLLWDGSKQKIIQSYFLPRRPKSVAVNSLKNIAVVADDEQDGLTIIPLPLSSTLPKVKITSPADNAQVFSADVAVTGTVENSSEVTVNGRPASVSGNAFSAALTLNAGKNTIIAIATDAYGRTASHDVTVDIVLPATGKINGTVTDSASGRPLPAAVVTVTDAAGNTQTLSTSAAGTFTAEVAPGAFTGSVNKPWYLPGAFAGSVAAGETAAASTLLSPVEPQIGSITVSDLTAESARITWTTDQPTQGAVQYGTTSAYGSQAADALEQTAHSLTLAGLSPVTVYHYRVVATSPNGSTVASGDNTFKTGGRIDLSITAPADGATVTARSVVVTGIIANASGVETGITVNGIAAALTGNQFAVNNVSLTAGANVITVTAMDVNGTTATKSVTVNAVLPDHYIKLSAYPESGTAPLEVNLRLGGTFSVSNPALTFTGPGAAEQLPGGVPEEYRYRLLSEGVYSFTARAAGPDGAACEDTISITVLPLEQVDALLRSKWAALSDALKNKDIAAALAMMDERSRERYQVIFNLLKDSLPDIMAANTGLVLQSITGERAYYELYAAENGATYAYRLSFIKDDKGLWLIKEF
jgi:hypothetical protein